MHASQNNGLRFGMAMATAILAGPLAVAWLPQAAATEPSQSMEQKQPAATDREQYAGTWRVV